MLGFVAQRAFGDAGTRAAGGDELAGKFDEVGRDLDRGYGVLEGGRLAEGNLVFESEALVFFNFIEGVLTMLVVVAAEGFGDGVGAVLVETDGEAGAGDLGGVGRGKSRSSAIPPQRTKSARRGPRFGEGLQ
jgi:hypothetical protein